MSRIFNSLVNTVSDSFEKIQTLVESNDSNKIKDELENFKIKILKLLLPAELTDTITAKIDNCHKIISEILAENDVEKRRKLIEDIKQKFIENVLSSSIFSFFAKEDSLVSPNIVSPLKTLKEEIKEESIKKESIKSKEIASSYDEVDLFEVIPPKKIELYNGLGFVELVDMMPRKVPVGRDADISIVRNARVSYLTKGDKTKEQDTKLINFLVKNKHTSPLESVVFQFHMRIPIFVERQLIRHRTARVNEQSMRYTAASDAFYYPELRMQSKNNKQCSSDESVPPELQEYGILSLRKLKNYILHI